MNLIAPGLAESIELDFRLACADLALAKRAMLAKDTPAARARVGRCATTVDRILDLRNATTPAPV